MRGSSGFVEVQERLKFRSRKYDEPLHSYLVELRMAYDRACTSLWSMNYQNLSVLHRRRKQRTNRWSCFLRVWESLDCVADDLNPGLYCKDYTVSGSADKQVSQIEEMVNKTVKLKVKEFRSSQGPFCTIRRGGRRTGRPRPGPKPTDVCRACNGRGHCSRSFLTLNGSGTGQGTQHQP